MCETNKEQLKYPELPSTRTDLGYSWQPSTPSDVLHAFGKFLQRNNARAFLMDVYASNDAVYRNMVIQLPEKGAFAAETIYIQFDRDEGRQYSLKTPE